jgi:DNA-binding NtrC family response regulator
MRLATFARLDTALRPPHNGIDFFLDPVSPKLTSMAHVLLIDDDPGLIPEQVRQAFPAPSHRVDVVRTGADGIERVSADAPDVILLDLRLPDQSGLDVYLQIRGIDGRIPVVFITMTKGADAAIEAMKQGAHDYLFKPLDLHQLRRVVGEALDIAKRMHEPAVVAETAADPDVDGAIVGACPAMREVYKSIGRVASQDVPVLITGESGTGKELVARAIYQHGARARGPFHVLNCAAIPENLLESELFGHEKGSFTGADRRRIGRFEQCNGGTLFLDEIGDMPLALQAKILRLVQEQEFERVGGTETIRTDVRLIAATHRDLKTWSADGKFRLDLYYRLGVFTIQLPSLRERDDDFEMLVQYYVRRFSRELKRDVQKVDPEVLTRLRQHTWPGNIRELQSVLKQSLLQATGPVLLPAFLPDLPRSNGESAPPQPPVNPFDMLAFISQRLLGDTDQLYADAHSQLDRLLLPRVLEFTDGNQHQAARLLGIARQTLRGKLRDLGLHVTRSVEADDNNEAPAR